MSEIKDGGPAFPFDERNGDGTHYHAHAGMTLRDYFAAKAMQAAHESTLAVYDVAPAYDRLAGHAYKVADAMLKARQA
jgi:hypothetical protein